MARGDKHDFGTASELRAHALNMWANHIETSNVSLSADDLTASQASVPKSDRLYPNALNLGQMKLVRRLRNLAKKELS